jgi:hypothetical protein
MKYMSKVVLSAALFATAQLASASPFTVTKATFTPGSGYGAEWFWDEIGGGEKLDVVFSNAGFTTQNFNLSTVGSTASFKVGTVKFFEDDYLGLSGWSLKTYGIDSGETDNLNVSLALTFTNPTSAVNTFLTTGTATLGPVGDNGVDYSLNWSPMTVSFGNGGQYTISLNSLSFSDVGSQDLYATVKLTHAVPEPGSLALIGLGLAGAGFMRRRQVS